jgi:hypothetical protein
VETSVEFGNNLVGLVQITLSGQDRLLRSRHILFMLLADQEPLERPSLLKLGQVLLRYSQQSLSARPFSTGRLPAQISLPPAQLALQVFLLYHERIKLLLCRSTLLPLFFDASIDALDPFALAFLQVRQLRL